MKKVFSFSVLVFLASCSPSNDGAYKAKVQDPEFFHRSMKAITDRIVHDIFSPPVASRIYSYASVAGYEAIIHQNKNYVSLAGQLHGLGKFPQPDSTKEYCYPLAATEAMLKVGRTLIFSEDELDKFYEKEMQKFRDAGVPDNVFERSKAFGDSVAKHVIKWSSKDNYKQSRTFPKYSIERNPATWQPTPPTYMDAIEPHWNDIRTFVIDSAQQFKPQPPTSFSEKKESQFYKEAFYVYETGKKLTDEQRAIASFWDCNPFIMNVKGHVMFATKKISPGGHWINITKMVCQNTHADMVRSAEAYVCVALSLADGFISCWDEKYRSKSVRPETYINQHIDENWVPLLQTPPFPEYTSGHSVISTSAAVALTAMFGDKYAFTDSTEVEFGMSPRSFKSFIDASEEAAVSRVYGGIHYSPACENGKVQGRKVGEFILSKLKTRLK
ncbi:MAG: vanadium-dependent haloperoxidase [Bacteroidetes bacterium]|nr:vanadium-dependent haloperoxidase [Bacteroidota bacterium]MBI3482162.1 vanadium-dependent haloperoxidase [Bacteroidota bacterium]